jgi:ubiquinone/menaquinone biosynthesis C-methylase UbiE
MQLTNDPANFHALQTQTGWGRTLAAFAEWCTPQPGWYTLDVGCGPGLLPSILASYGCWAAGIDIDQGMFMPQPLHPEVVVGDIFRLPFDVGEFDLVTGSNLLFMLPEPVKALIEMKRVLKTNGKVAMLNPSEALSKGAVQIFIDERSLIGVARETMVLWAERAEAHSRWTEAETYALYNQSGLKCMSCSSRVGSGFARFSYGIV